MKYVIEDTGCSVEEAMVRVYDSLIMAAPQDEEGREVRRYQFRDYFKDK